MLYFNVLAYIKGFKGSVLTNSSSGIQHAWHFWYAVISVLKCYAAAWSMRASPLNWALGFILVRYINSWKKQKKLHWVCLSE